MSRFPADNGADASGGTDSSGAGVPLIWDSIGPTVDAWSGAPFVTRWDPLATWRGVATATTVTVSAVSTQPAVSLATTDISCFQNGVYLETQTVSAATGIPQVLS